MRNKCRDLRLRSVSHLFELSMCTDTQLLKLSSFADTRGQTGFFKGLLWEPFHRQVALTGRNPALLIRPGRAVAYCDRFVCLCVCLSVRSRAYVRNCWTDLHKIFVHIPCGYGSVFLWWHCDTLYTSGFMDDVTFGHSGPYGNALKAEPLTYYH